MNRYIKRIITALVFSSFGFFGTVYWFNASKHETNSGNRTPLARLSESANEVQRKPVKRVIWETVSRNDELFSGEAIRTAANAEAQLRFVKSGTVVRLEPDSLVVLEENDKGLSLDFLQGNLLVQSTGNKGKGSANEELTLKMGKGQMKLNSADLSLSKSDNGSVNIEVHRGQAELEQAGKKTQVTKETAAEVSASGAVKLQDDLLQILEPAAGQTLYLNLGQHEKLNLAWKNLPAGYDVSVEVGQSRQHLDVAPNQATSGESGHTQIAIKPGSHFLRLVAQSHDPKLPKLTSRTVPFTVEAKASPLLVEPEKEAQLSLDTLPNGVQFKWVNRHNFTSQTIEVASDAQFKNHIVQESFNVPTVQYVTPLQAGKYYWRVTGFLPIKNKTEPVSSAVATFTLKASIEVPAPELLFPKADQHLSFIDINKTGVHFTWNTSAKVRDFKVSLEYQSPQGWIEVTQQSAVGSTTTISDLKPGQYRWKVASLDNARHLEKNSSTRQFVVDDLMKIDWLHAEQSVYEYHTPTPALAADWKPLATAPSVYRYKLTPQGGNPEMMEWHTTRQTHIDVAVPRDGEYTVLVEAMNAKGQAFSRSESRVINVKQFPLLPAPQWTADTPPTVKSDTKGNVTLNWNNVAGAKNYILILEDPKGQVINQQAVTRNVASVGRLHPGEYKVRLKAVDSFERSSSDAEARSVMVPNISGLRAPKIKAMKVK